MYYHTFVLYLIFMFVILVLILLSVVAQLKTFYFDQRYLFNVVCLDKQIHITKNDKIRLINTLIIYKLWYIIFFKYLDNDCVCDYLSTDDQKNLAIYIYNKLDVLVLLQK